VVFQHSCYYLFFFVGDERKGVVREGEEGKTAKDRNPFTLPIIPLFLILHAREKKLQGEEDAEAGALIFAPYLFSFATDGPSNFWRRRKKKMPKGEGEREWRSCEGPGYLRLDLYFLASSPPRPPRQEERGAERLFSFIFTLIILSPRRSISNQKKKRGRNGMRGKDVDDFTCPYLLSRIALLQVCSMSGRWGGRKRKRKKRERGRMTSRDVCSRCSYEEKREIGKGRGQAVSQVHSDANCRKHVLRKKGGGKKEKSA